MRHILTLILVSLFAVTGAAAENELVQALQAKVKFAEAKPTLFGGWRVVAPGTPLLVQRDGLSVGFTGDLRRTTNLKSGELESSSGGAKLKVGDKVYIYKVDSQPSQLVIHVVTADTFDNMNEGSVTHEHGVEDFVFAYDKPLSEVGTATVLADVGKWFTTESEASAARTIKLGQSPEEVEAILGQPDKRVDLGTKVIYTYKDMKIVFVDRKVSDVQ